MIWFKITPAMLALTFSRDFLDVMISSEVVRLLQQTMETRLTFLARMMESERSFRGVPSIII